MTLLQKRTNQRATCLWLTAVAMAMVLASNACADPAAKANKTGFWNQFRGATADGRTEATNLPITWSEKENITWKTPIHGKGWSSPVVWEDQIWVTTATIDGTELSLLSLDAATGKILTDAVVFKVAEPKFCHPTNSYASPTPFIEDGKVYVHFGAYGTACIDTTTGKKDWERRDFVCDDFRGPGSSPVIDGDLLLVHFDGVDIQYVVALDKSTGRTVWKQDRDIDYETNNPDRKKAYGTPLVINHQGRRQMISPSAMETIAYDPPTGKVLWRVRHGGMNAAARPLYDNGLLYISAGQGDRSLIAVRPHGSGQLPDDAIVWSTAQSVPRRPSQIVADGLLIMIDDKGIASCLDAASGATHWRERLAGEFWASPIWAEGRVYCSSKEGKTVVLEASKTFRKLAENQLDETIVASPAVVESDLLIRTATHLYRITRTP